MAWDVFDFAVVSALLLGVGSVYALAAWRTDDTVYRSAVGIALAAAFILVWINGAVGIIGDEGNDANMMYVGVLGVAIAGAVIARFRPQGMAYAMFATAFAQVSVAVIALIARLGAAAPIWPRDILVLTGFFAALWLLAAWLFRTAARRGRPAAADPRT